MSIGKVIARNITANYFGVTGQVMIAFFISPFLVHTLGDVKYGIWSVIAALSGYMSLLDLGVAAALTRYTASYYQKKEYEKINGLLSSALFLFLIITVIIISFSSLLASEIISFFSFDTEFKEIIYVLIIIVSFDVSLFVIGGLFRGALGGFQRFDIINIARLSSMLFKALAFYLFLSKGFGLVAMGYISLASNLFLLLFYFWALKKYYSFTHLSTKKVSRIHIDSVFNYSKFVFVAMLANQLLGYSSSFIIGYYIGAAAITWFSIPYSLAEYVKQFIIAMSRTYIPVFSHLETADDYKSIYSHYISGTRYILIVSNLFSIGMIVMGTAFISIWMGDKYAEKAEPLIVIMFISMYFLSPQLISYALLQGISKHKMYAYANIVLSVVSLLLCVILIKDYGLFGVALGIAVPQVLFCSLLVPAYVSKVLNYNFFDYYWQTHLRLFIPTISLFFVLTYIKGEFYPDSFLSLIGESFIGAIIYFVLVYFFSLSKEDKNNINKLLERILRKA